MSYQGTPLGVLILAGLQVIQALVLLIPAALLMIIPFIGWILGLPMLLVGLFLFFIAWGLLTMQSWAWTWALIMNIIGLLIALVNRNFIGVILSLVIVLYLNQPEIKGRFV
ncbi:hypothetical protein EU545_01850 [Candidatus Thorarchaeota archaeon]|nr:MAG: hypothetical protein EU545_01850 [Candidatus Thorarchaeota archaeon]